jgi:hypothetical protein
MAGITFVSKLTKIFYDKGSFEQPCIFSYDTEKYNNNLINTLSSIYIPYAVAETVGVPFPPEIPMEKYRLGNINAYFSAKRLFSNTGKPQILLTMAILPAYHIPKETITYINLKYDNDSNKWDIPVTFPKSVGIIKYTKTGVVKNNPRVEFIYSLQHKQLQSKVADYKIMIDFYDTYFEIKPITLILYNNPVTI